MEEQEAREMAIVILDEFEELLAEHDIVIPSDDREGREEEACLYGSQYYELEDEITDLLLPVSDRPGSKQWAREVSFEVLEAFEEILKRHGIEIPSGELGRQESDAAIYGQDYDRLRGKVIEILLRHGAAVDSTKSEIAGQER
jgi:hypothetical protein